MEIAIQQKIYDNYIEACRWDKKLDFIGHITPMYLAEAMKLWCQIFLGSLTF